MQRFKLFDELERVPDEGKPYSQELVGYLDTYDVGGTQRLVVWRRVNAPCQQPGFVIEPYLSIGKGQDTGDGFKVIAALMLPMRRVAIFIDILSRVLRDGSH
jgi:hypothetical protein